MNSLDAATECLYRTAKACAGRPVVRGATPTKATRMRDDLRSAVAGYERAVKRATRAVAVTTLTDADPAFELGEYWWLWCDIEGGEKRWLLGLLNDGRDDTLEGPCVYFPADDFNDSIEPYVRCPAVRAVPPQWPPKE